MSVKGSSAKIQRSTQRLSEEMVMTCIASSLGEAVRKAFKDPDIQREYEEWLKEYERKQNSGKQV